MRTLKIISKVFGSKTYKPKLRIVCLGRKGHLTNFQFLMKGKQTPTPYDGLTTTASTTIVGVPPFLLSNWQQGMNLHLLFCVFKQRKNKQTSVGGFHPYRIFRRGLNIIVHIGNKGTIKDVNLEIMIWRQTSPVCTISKYHSAYKDNIHKCVDWLIYFK